MTAITQPSLTNTITDAIKDFPLADTVKHYFLMKEMDRAGEIVKRIIADIYQKGLSMETAISGTLSFQQVHLLNHLMLAAYNFQSIYKEEMEKTIDKVDAVVKNRLEHLATIVYSATHGLLKNTEIQIQLQQYEALAHTYLSMSGGKPIVTGVYPLCVAPSKEQNDVSIQCSGFFPNVADSLLTPILTLKEQKFEPVKNIGILEFAIPYKLLFSDDNDSLKAIEYTLKLPHRNPTSNEVEKMAFKGWLSLLPPSPGKVLLEYIELKKEVLTEPRHYHFWQDSRPVRAGGCGFTLIDQPYTLHAGEGWTIVPGSSKVVCPKIEGNASARLGSEGPAAAVFLVTTHHVKVNGFYGRIECGISAVATRTVEIPERKVQPLDLSWRDSFQIDPTKHKNWKVHFEAFNGLKSVYSGNTEDLFISIKTPGGVPTISMTVPTSGISFGGAKL